MPYIIYLDWKNKEVMVTMIWHLTFAFPVLGNN